MPYIIQSRRDELKRLPVPKTAGELNYLITLELIKAYEDGGIHIQTPTIFKLEVNEIVESYLEHNKLSYQIINDVLGALSGAAREFDYRVRIKLEMSDVQIEKMKTLNSIRFSDTRFRQYFNVKIVLEILEDVAQQFYNTVAISYEKKKIAENGDVYPTELR